MSQPTEPTAGNAAPSAGNSAGLTRSQIRGSGLLVLGNLISLVITFFPHLLLVRYLSTQSYGLLAYGLTVISVCRVYALGFNEAMSRFVPIHQTEGKLPKALGTVVVVFGLTLGISALFITALSVAGEPILRVLTKGKEPLELLLVLMFLIPMETIEILIRNLFACFNRTKEIFWGHYVFPPGLRVIAIGLMVFGHHGILFLAHGYVIAEAITVTIFGSLLLREMRRQGLFHQLGSLREAAREVFGFSVPLFSSNAIGLLGGHLPILLLGYFYPMSAVAIYRVVLPAAALSNMVVGNFMPLYLPSASRLYAEGDGTGMNHLFWQTALWMSVLAFPIFLTTACFARPLTVFMYGSRYAVSAPILAILSLGYFSNVIYGFSGVTLKAMGKIRIMVMLNLLTPVIAIVLDLLLIPHFGALGAAVATAASMIAQNLWRHFELWRRSSVSFFSAEYASFFAVLGSGALALFLLERVMHSNIYLAVAFAALVATYVLWRVKSQLKIAETFPEVLRLPLVGRLFA